MAAGSARQRQTRADHSSVTDAKRADAALRATSLVDVVETSDQGLPREVLSAVEVQSNAFDSGYRQGEFICPAQVTHQARCRTSGPCPRMSASSCSRWPSSVESDSYHAPGYRSSPMNYRLGPDHQLFMKTAPGSALAQLAEVYAPVAFEVDYHADDFQIAWSVLMNGTISRLDATATAAYEELRRPPVPWAGSASSLPVRFVPRTVSGRGLHRTRPD